MIELPRKTTSVIAAAVAVLILLVGGLLWLTVGPHFDGPTKTTRVVETGQGAGIGKSIKTTEVSHSSETTESEVPETAGSDPSKDEEKSTKTVERPAGSPSGKKTRTIEEGSRSFAERVLGDSGLALLQLGVIVLAAFLAAAAVQRVLIGDYTLKIGPIEIGAAQESKEDVWQTLTADLDKTIKTQRAERTKLAKVGRKLSENTVTTAELASAVRSLEDRIEKLKPKPGGAK